MALPPRARAATPLVFSPARLKFGHVALYQTETQVVVLTNAGSTSTTISRISVSGSEFNVSSPKLPFDLSPGEQVALSVTFTPITIGWLGETITFIDASQLTLGQLDIAGAGAKNQGVMANPSTLSFGTVSIGATATRSVVLSNDRFQSQTLSSFDFETPGSAFSISGPKLPVTLAPGQRITFNVTFTPTADGVDGDSIFVSGPFLSIPLVGTGKRTGQLAFAPTGMNFGKVDVGSTKTQACTLSATGGSVTVSSAASSDSQYAIPGASFPLKIAAGQSVVVDVVFSPSKSGASSGNLTLASDALNNPSKEPLAGTGVVPQYSVNLSWSSSTSLVVGYNVYRGTAAGAYSKINQTLNPGTSYTDATAVSGKTYYYAATAVNSGGEESAYSAPVEVAVP